MKWHRVAQLASTWNYGKTSEDLIHRCLIDVKDNIAMKSNKARIMPTIDKQEPCQQADKKAIVTDNGRQELISVLVTFLRDVGEGKID